MRDPLITRGEFTTIDPTALLEGREILRQLAAFQLKYGYHDADTVVNMLRDSMVGKLMGFPLINAGKHGFDAASDENLLEIKNCSLGKKTIAGTWNDTTEDKALTFSEPNVHIALAVWTPHTVDPAFIVYGSHAGIGEWLHERVVTRKPGSRSTQSLHAHTLINTYGFRVYCGETNRANVLNVLHQNHKSLKVLTEEDLLPYPGAY